MLDGFIVSLVYGVALTRPEIVLGHTAADDAALAEQRRQAAELAPFVAAGVAHRKKQPEPVARRWACANCGAAFRTDDVECSYCRSARP